MAHSLAETNLWFGGIAGSILDDLERTGRTVDRWVDHRYIGMSWTQHVDFIQELKCRYLQHLLIFNIDYATLTVANTWCTKFDYADPAFPDNLRTRLQLPPD